MELLDYENIRKACRLCLKHDGIKLPIFGEVGVQRDVAHKINTCFALVVYETDPLSKLICHRCLYKLEQNYEFRTDVLNAFQHLKKALNLRRSDPEIDKYLSIAEDEIIVIGRSETCHPGKEHGSEMANEIVQNSAVQPSGVCITVSGHSAGDPDEQIEIVEHSPFDDNSSVDVHDVAAEVHTGNIINDENKVFKCDENEIACISNKPNNHNYSGNIIEADKEAQNELIGSQNVLETLLRPGDKSGKREKHDGFMKKRSSLLANSTDLQWCNLCQKYLKNKTIFKRHNFKVHSAVRSQNVLETLLKPGDKSGKREKRDGFLKKKSSLLTKSTDLQWCNFCQKYLKTKKIFKRHNVKFHSAVRPQNVLETLLRPGDKSGKREKCDGFMKKKSSLLTKSTDLQWCNYCQKYLKTKKIFQQHNVKFHSAVRSQNVLETLLRPGDKSGKRKKRDGFMKKRSSLLTKSTDLQWCNYCQKYLKTKKIFKQHNVKFHSAVRSATYKCKCKRKFHSLFEMLTHQQTHLKVKMKITEDMLLKCNLCDKKFSDNSILTLHLTAHNQTFKDKPSFQSCTNKFDITKKIKTKPKAKTVISATASPSKLLVCDHCWQIFETASSLSLHLNSKHCIISCNCISAENNSSVNSGVHTMKGIMQPVVQNGLLQNTQISAKHSVDRPSDSTASVIPLETSTVDSNTQLPDNTGAKISDKNSANYDQLAALVNQCTICAKVFSSKKSLKKHCKSHIAPEATSFFCTLCNRKFLKRSGLISHLYMHSGDKSYHCKYCTKIYPNKEILLIHKCLRNKVYPFCDSQLSHSSVVCVTKPHQNSKEFLSLLDHEAKQINVLDSSQTSSFRQSEDPKKECTRLVQFPKKIKNNNNKNRNKNHKHIKRCTSEYSRAAQISRNENCMKCPFCHHLVKPETMYQHIFENHPDSNNIIQ